MTRHAGSSPGPGDGRPRRPLVIVVVVVTVVALGAIAVVALRRPTPREPVPPPAPDLALLERPLAARIRHLTATARTAPDSAEAWGRLAVCYDVHELLPEAVACYDRAETLDPADFRWPYFLGFALAETDRRAGLAAHRRALRLRPDYAPLHHHLGRALLAIEELDAARDHLQTAIELEPSLIAAHLALAELALTRQQPRAALEHLDRAAALGPSAGQIHSYRAEAHRRLGDLDAAEQELERAGRPVVGEPVPDPVRRAGQYDAGVSRRWRRLRSGNALAEGDPDRALAEWNALLRDEPGDAEALEQIGRIHHLANRADEAIAAYEQAIEADPARHELRNTLGALLARSGQAERGLRLLRASCAELPGDLDAHMNLALALRDLGRGEESRAVLERIVDRHPDDLDARFELGVALGRAGCMEEAADALGPVAAADPERSAAHTILAKCLAGAGRHGEALDVLHQAHARAPNDPQIVNDLAWMLATCPDASLRAGAESRRLIEPLCARSRYRNPFLLDTLAAACAETGDFDEAVRCAELALELAASRGGGFRVLEDPLRARLALYRARHPFREP